MELYKNIAILIDADNAQLEKLPLIIEEIATRGHIGVKRAYGNWSKPTFKNWEDTLMTLAIKAVQQFDYVKGKNATDIGLVIEGMELLYTGLHDAFAIVSSDSDFTMLAIKFRESGVAVLGVGNEKTPESFRSACEDFILIENLSEDDGTASSVADNVSASEEEVTSQGDEPNVKGAKKIHKLLNQAYNAYSGDDGFAEAGAAGNYIKRVWPEFRIKNYGFKTLTMFIEAFPQRYEVKKVKGNKNSSIVYYRCL